MKTTLTLPLASMMIFSACATGVTKQFNYTMLKDRIYKTVDGQELSGDLYLPESKGPKPAVLVVHGGGWSSRSGKMLSIAEELAVSGFVVFNITYRLAPEALYPKAIEDVRDALQFLRIHASEFEIDPHRISGWGYSAGAHLILMVGLDPKNDLKSIVAGGTPADFTAWPNSPIVKKFTGGTYVEKKDLWEEASPVRRVDAKSPPVFMYHGEWDSIVEIEQMHKMRDALKAKGITVETHTVKYSGHITTYLFSEKSIQLGIEFIQRHSPIY